MPVSAIRTRMRQEFERQRFVNKLSVVDVLLFKSHAEYQVRSNSIAGMNRCTVGFYADLMDIGDNELLEADQSHHGLLQGGELPR